MKRIILYTVCGMALASMLNSCHIYRKYQRPDDITTEGLFRDTISAGEALPDDSLNILVKTPPCVNASE